MVGEIGFKVVHKARFFALCDIAPLYRAENIAEILRFFQCLFVDKAREFRESAVFVFAAFKLRENNR